MDPQIFPAGGRITFTPGSGTSSPPCYQFTFVNASQYPICDFQITVHNPAAFGTTSEVLKHGVTVEPVTFTAPGGAPAAAPGQGTKANLGSPKPISGAGDESSEAHVTINPSDTTVGGATVPEGNCIQPGEFFAVTICLDDPLGASETVSFQFSTKHNGRERWLVGGNTDEPKPLTWGEILKILIDLGKIGAEQGAKKAIDSVAGTGSSGSAAKTTAAAEDVAKSVQAQIELAADRLKAALREIVVPINRQLGGKPESAPTKEPKTVAARRGRRRRG